VLITALIHQAQGASLDMALTRALKWGAGLSAPGRRQVVRDLYEINRHRARLIWHITQLGAEVAPDTMLAAYTAFQPSGETWGETFDDAHRMLMGRISGRLLNDREMPQADRLECPPAFEARLREALGDDFEQEMLAALRPAPVDLRVNILKLPIEAVIKRLKAQDIDAVPTPLSPWGLRCPNGANASSTSAFRDGLIEFQDEGSQIAALLCDAQPGMQVMDFCAGTGGKSLALGAAMQNRGHVVACDISEVRLARAKIRLKRAGVENAERKLLPAQDDKWMKRHHGRFDRVLVDAPCSGTGSWRRNPDVRWSTQASNLEELTALQGKIIERASHFVKPGGVMIYATCSLLPAENDERVDDFLRSHPDFERVDARETWARLRGTAWMCGDSPTLKLSPARHGTDGFFAAILRKATNPA
jgi:16S rRNA (cytosine967-C5)-methyltransferase